MNTETTFDEVDVTCKCPICNDTGWTYYTDKVGDYEYEFARECVCQVRARSKDRAEASGLGELLGRYTFATYSVESPWQKHIYGEAVRYLEKMRGVDEPRGWFYIGGQSGCGKTHICTAIANVILSDYPLLYMRWVEDMNRLKYDTNKALLERYKKAKFLVIDDLYKYPPGHEEAEMTYDLINHRYMNKMPTIISSERTLDELLKMDTAIAGRIKEHAIVEISIRDDSKRNIRLKGDKNE